MSTPTKTLTLTLLATVLIVATSIGQNQPVKKFSVAATPEKLDTAFDKADAAVGKRDFETASTWILNAAEQIAHQQAIYKAQNNRLESELKQLRDLSGLLASKKSIKDREELTLTRATTHEALAEYFHISGKRLAENGESSAAGHSFVAASEHLEKSVEASLFTFNEAGWKMINSTRDLGKRLLKGGKVSAEDQVLLKEGGELLSEFGAQNLEELVLHKQRKQGTTKTPEIAAVTKTPEPIEIRRAEVPKVAKAAPIVENPRSVPTIEPTAPELDLAAAPKLKFDPGETVTPTPRNAPSKVRKPGPAKPSPTVRPTPPQPPKSRPTPKPTSRPSPPPPAVVRVPAPPRVDPIEKIKQTIEADAPRRRYVRRKVHNEASRAVSKTKSEIQKGATKTKKGIEKGASKLKSRLGKIKRKIFD